MGKQKPFSWDKLDVSLEYQASKGVCADRLEVSEDTIDNRIKKKYNMTFTEYKKKRTEHMAMRLKDTIIKKALKGDNVCLIFSLKNLSDWVDRKEQTINLEKKSYEEFLSDMEKEK